MNIVNSFITERFLEKKNRILGFTLIELLVVIGVVSTLSTALVVVLNPMEILARARDSKRIVELQELNKALGLYSLSNFSGWGTLKTVYVSVPDTSAICANLGLPSLPSGWSYSCRTEADYRRTDGNGWMPVNFNSISQGAPFSVLPIDPVNSASQGLFYTYVTGGSYELTALIESQKYLETAAKDGGPFANLFEVGTDLNLSPYINTFLVRNGDAETGNTSNWTNYNGITTDTPHQGVYAFRAEGNRIIESQDFIPIALNKAYGLEGWFSSYGIGQSRLYFGFVPYDVNKQRITIESIYIYPNTQTTLYEACNSSDKIVKIVNGNNWVVYQYGHMAFNIDDSGSYNDLPNGNLSNVNIVRVQNMGAYWEVEFNTTVGKSYPAGTKVREHRSGATYMYSAANAVMVPSVWTKYSSVTQGESLYGNTTTQWWRGTRYVRILMLTNYSQSNDYKLKIDDIVLAVN